MLQAFSTGGWNGSTLCGKSIQDTAGALPEQCVQGGTLLSEALSN